MKISIDEFNMDILQNYLVKIFNIPTWTFTYFTKGKTNKTIKCTSNHLQVIVRIYGKGSDQLIDRHNEIENINFLYIHNLAPLIHYRFQNGFIIEYIDGKELENEDMKIEYGAIAKKMKEWHSLKIGEEETFFATLQNWYDLAAKKHPKFLKDLKILNYIECLRKRVEELECQTSLCHNDLLASNIIRRPDGSIFFIDYEYAGVSYCSFDIANHLVEYAGYDMNCALIPKKEEIRRFVKEYDIAKVEKICTEVQVFMPASHCYWGLWALVKEGDFDYESYGKAKLDECIKLYKTLEP